MKVLHTWGVSTNNAGDFLLGPATRQWFENNISKATFDYKSCRDSFNTQTVDRINDQYDALLVGGGGLILPDTNPNKISCWQLGISKEDIQRIKIPIYVVSIGYNLFYNQTICMPHRENNYEDKSRLSIFNDNISTLIDKSAYFSVRHKGDIERLKQHVPSSLHEKIKFQFCPTIEYAKTFPKGRPSRTVAFEIKEDRTWRRYYKTSKEHVFRDICRFCKQIGNYTDIAVLLHEPNNGKIVEYLKKNNVRARVIPNYQLSVESTIQNFQSIDTLFCMAGHSQMVAHALGCNVKSIITHDKLKYYLQDINQYKDENYIDPNSEDVYNKLMDIYDY